MLYLVTRFYSQEQVNNYIINCVYCVFCLYFGSPGFGSELQRKELRKCADTFTFGKGAHLLDERITV